MYDYFFQIAGLIIKMESPQKIPLDSSVVLFQTNRQKEDLLYTIYEKELDISGMQKRYSSKMYDIYETESSRIRRAKVSCNIMALERSKRNSDITVLWGKKETIRELGKIILSNWLAPEEPLLEHHAFILHASFIKWKNQGILFSAPSGTGKSTQADLWQRHLGADIINGDKTIVRRFDDGYRAYGSMFAGSSGIYRNESASLRAIVLLEQAEENVLIPVKNALAFQKLYSQIVSNPWNKNFVERLTEELLILLKYVPVYLLRCRPEYEAVELVKQEMERIHDEKK